MLSRLRSLDPRQADALLAAAILLPTLLQVLWLLPIASRGVGLLIALGTALPLAWRRTHPLAAALAGTIVWLIPADGYPLLGYLATVLLFYSLTAYGTTRARQGIGVAVGVVLAVAASFVQDEPIGDYAGALLAVLAPAAVGAVVRRQRAQARRLEELTWHLERERERGAETAVAEERARIARELHDVVSHGISVIAIQSDVADVALDRDRERARESLHTVRSSAREALGEMRRLLGVLREDGAEDCGARAPLPSLADIPALIERVRATGQVVTFDVHGEPAELSASAGLSAYRIVQEALTNVRKHAAGAAAHVTLVWSADELELRVRDEGPGPLATNGGHGLVGMRERVRVHGGTIRAGGHAPSGGFEVVAVLPLREPAVTA